MAKMSEKDPKITSLIFFPFLFGPQKNFFSNLPFWNVNTKKKGLWEFNLFSKPFYATYFVCQLNWVKSNFPELNWKNYFVVCYTNKVGPSLKLNMVFLGEVGWSYFECQKIINKHRIMNVTHKIKISIFFPMNF